MGDNRTKNKSNPPKETLSNKSNDQISAENDHATTEPQITTQERLPAFDAATLKKSDDIILRAIKHQLEAIEKDRSRSHYAGQDRHERRQNFAAELVDLIKVADLDDTRKEQIISNIIQAFDHTNLLKALVNTTATYASSLWKGIPYSSETPKVGTNSQTILAVYRDELRREINAKPVSLQRSTH